MNLIKLLSRFKVKQIGSLPEGRFVDRIAIDLSDRINNPGDVLFFIPLAFDLNESKRLVGFKDRYGIGQLFGLPELNVHGGQQLCVGRWGKNARFQVDDPAFTQIQPICFSSCGDQAIARWLHSLFCDQKNYGMACRAAVTQLKVSVSGQCPSHLLGACDSVVLIGFEIRSRRNSIAQRYPSESVDQSWHRQVEAIANAPGRLAVLVGTEPEQRPKIDARRVLDLRGKTSLRELTALILDSKVEIIVCRDNFVGHLSNFLRPDKAVIVPRRFFSRSEFHWLERRFFNAFE